MNISARLFPSIVLACGLGFILAGCMDRSSENKPVVVAPAAQSKDMTLEEYFAQLKKDAATGNAEAQFYLGKIYLRGEGTTGVAYVRDIPRDSIKAIEWFQKAAEQGNVNAQSDLGMVYKLGLGVKEDAGKAFIWIQKAAAQGNDVAQYNLGLMYADGTGVKPNLARACAWLYLSAAQGNEKAKNSFIAMDAKLTSAQRAEGRRLATNWNKGEVI